MGTTLQHGIFLPAEGERNCYTGLASNWTIIDGVVGGYSSHAANLTIHVTAADKEAWNGKADASALTAHTGDTTIHVTAADKSRWDAVTTKANDTDVLHKAGTETIPGAKTFSTFITAYGSSIGDEYSGNAKTNFWLMSNRDTEEVSGVLFDTFRQNTAQGTGSHILGIGIKENAVRYEGCRFSWLWDNNLNGYSFSIRPTLQGTNQAVEHCIGLSTDKWDKINGVSPGALSLPNLSAGVDISAYITDITGASNINKFTPTADGWISIGLSNADFIEIYIPSNLMGASFAKNTLNNSGLAFMPVIANKEVKIALKGSSIGWAKFYPCQGNV